jgi:phosphomannomutase/phosphoglucomutase
MKEIGAVFTGEMSGHIFFADEYYGYDDAFYAAGRLLRILSNSDQPLSNMLAGIPKYYSTAETRVPCPDQDKFRVVKELVEQFKRQYEVIDVDGLRVLFGDGWGLVRASNTQPVLVARCEAKTPAGLERICGIMMSALEKYPEVGKLTGSIIIKVTAGRWLVRPRSAVGSASADQCAAKAAPTGSGALFHHHGLCSINLSTT